MASIEPQEEADRGGRRGFLINKAESMPAIEPRDMFSKTRFGGMVRLPSFSAIAEGETEPVEDLYLTPNRHITAAIPAPGSSGADLVLDEEALEYMRREKLRLNLLPPPPVAEDTSRRALRRIWGTGGSWQISTDEPWGPEGFGQLRKASLAPSCEYTSDLLLKQIGVAVASAKGRSPRNEISQDSFSVSVLQTGWEVYCVADGHGQSGHWPAIRVAKTLPYFLECGRQAVMLRNMQVAEALEAAFELAQKDLVRRSWEENIGLHFTGCTVTVALRHPSRSSVWVATVGDTRAVMMVPGLGPLMETVDHKPTVKAERDRIEACGGEIRTTTHSDGTVERRVFLRGAGYPGLCPTRVLGDTASTDCGVSHAPEIVEWALDRLPQEALLVVATDGLWEFMEPRRVAESLRSLRSQVKGESLTAVVPELVKLAQAQWDINEAAGYADDVTVMAIPVCNITHTRVRPARSWASAILPSCFAGCCP